LLAQLKQGIEIQVGKLGTFHFPAGWYAYAGSALGPGGLPARLARHARTHKRLHWHVDYLLQHAVLEAIWQTDYPERLECAWAAAVQALPCAQTPVRGFGASDCRCRAHLILFPRRPDDRQIETALARHSPAQARLDSTPHTRP
jgi:Uri superfamily endonuclease